MLTKYLPKEKLITSKNVINITLMEARLKRKRKYKVMIEEERNYQAKEPRVSFAGTFSDLAAAIVSA